VTQIDYRLYGVELQAFKRKTQKISIERQMNFVLQFYQVFEKNMLSQLTINNYAIVEQLDLELKSGMTVITGETGAGKSIMLDALALTLGRTKPKSVPTLTLATINTPLTGSNNKTMRPMVSVFCVESSPRKVAQRPISMAGRLP
jgi:energy-coupling factor transporter ATP-binding protein EcfA2